MLTPLERLWHYVGVQTGGNVMANEIRVQVKSVYGEEKVYPVCEDAKTFAQLAGTKTLTRETLMLIRRLGYEIEVVSPAYDF